MHYRIGQRTKVNLTDAFNGVAAGFGATMLLLTLLALFNFRPAVMLLQALFGWVIMG